MNKILFSFKSQKQCFCSKGDIIVMIRTVAHKRSDSNQNEIEYQNTEGSKKNKGHIHTITTSLIINNNVVNAQPLHLS